jgi:hypothetical protein
MRAKPLVIAISFLIGKPDIMLLSRRYRPLTRPDAYHWSSLIPKRAERVQKLGTKSTRLHEPDAGSGCLHYLCWQTRAKNLGIPYVIHQPHFSPQKNMATSVSLLRVKTLICRCCHWDPALLRSNGYPHRVTMLVPQQHQVFCFPDGQSLQTPPPVLALQNKNQFFAVLCSTSKFFPYSAFTLFVSRSIATLPAKFKPTTNIRFVPMLLHQICR